MSKIQSPKTPVVAVLNMKGGVGKTTVSAHLMRHMFERMHWSTLLIDLDPQHNLTQTILTPARYASLQDEHKTVARVMEPTPATSLFSVTQSGSPPPLEAQVSSTLLRFSQSGKSLSLVAGSFELTKYSLIEDVPSLKPIRQRFIDFVEESKKTRDLICIDCNPSSSFLTLCALMAATHVLIPVRPDRYSVVGLQILDKFIDEIPIIKRKPKLMVLLNGIKSNHTETNVETQLRGDSKYGPMVLGNHLRYSELLAANDGYIGFATDKKAAHSSALKTRLSKIADEIKGRLDEK